MNFTITQNNPYATQLVGPGVSYIVHSSPLRRHTTVSRGGGGAVVAQMDWHSFSPDVVRIGLGGAGAEAVLIRKFLRPESGGSRRSKRTFTFAGQTYTWHPSRSRMTLRSGETPLATLQRHPLTLHISQSAPTILPLDIIVTTMLIMWTFRHRRIDENRDTSASAGVDGGPAGCEDAGAGGGILSDGDDDDDGGGDWGSDRGGRGGDDGGGGGGGMGGDGGGGGAGDSGGGGPGGAD